MAYTNRTPQNNGRQGPAPQRSQSQSPVSRTRQEMSEEKKFDPRDYLMKVKGKDYLEVSWRLVWFRQDWPQGRIEVKILSHSGNEAVCWARVETGAGGCAEGIGSEDVGDFPDYIEKASTKAIGRALAGLGYGTQFTDDFVFDALGDRVVDAPQELRSKPEPLFRQPPRNVIPLSDDVEDMDESALIDDVIVNDLRTLAGKKISEGRIDGAGLQELLWQHAGVEKVDQLTVGMEPGFREKLNRI